MSDPFDVPTPAPAPASSPEHLPEAAYSFTMKTALGDLFSVRGGSVEDFKANLGGVIGDERVTKIVGELRERIDKGAPAPQSKPQSGGNQGSGGNTPASAPAQSQPASEGSQAPSGQAPHCQHGEMQYRTWQKNSGPAHLQGEQHTYFCPLGKEVDRSQKCTPIDADTMKPWGK